MYVHRALSSLLQEILAGQQGTFRQHQLTGNACCLHVTFELQRHANKMVVFSSWWVFVSGPKDGEKNGVFEWYSSQVDALYQILKCSSHYSISIMLSVSKQIYSFSFSLFTYINYTSSDSWQRRKGARKSQLFLYVQDILQSGSYSLDSSNCSNSVSEAR